MEAFTSRLRPFPECLDKTLRHIIRVNVVQRLATDIRKCDPASFGKVTKYLRIEVRRRIQREPSFSHQMTGMQYGS